MNGFTIGDKVVVNSGGTKVNGTVTAIHFSFGKKYYEMMDDRGMIMVREEVDVSIDPNFIPYMPPNNHTFGNFPWDDEEVTSEDPLPELNMPCWHTYEKYVGFTETYDFCTKCGEKSK